MKKDSSATFSSGVLIADEVQIKDAGPDGVARITLDNKNNPVSAALEIQSTEGGLLFPRLTNALRDEMNPTAGLTIFNTEVNRLQVYQGGAWVNLEAGGVVAGDVVGPANATPDNLPSFANNTGKVLKDSGILSTNVVTYLQPNATANNIAIFVGGGAGVKTVRDSGVNINRVPAPLPLLQRPPKRDLGLPRAVFGVSDYLSFPEVDSVGFYVQDYVGLQLVDNTSQVCTLITGTLPETSTTPSALLELQSTTGALLLSRLTSAEIGLLDTPVDGMLLYNATTNTFQGRSNGVWSDFGAGGGTGTVTSITTTTPNLTLNPATITNAGTITLNTDLTNLNSIEVGGLRLDGTNIRQQNASDVITLGQVGGGAIVVEGSARVFGFVDIFGGNPLSIWNGTGNRNVEIRVSNAATANDRWILPLNPGTPGQFLTTAGPGATNQLSWTSGGTGTGTVTSITLQSNSSGLTITNPTITTSGTIELTLSSSLDSLNTLSSNGLVVRNGSGYLTRTLTTNTPNVLLGNPDGVSGNPSVTLNSDLTTLTSVEVGGLLLFNTSIWQTTLSDTINIGRDLGGGVTVFGGLNSSGPLRVLNNRDLLLYDNANNFNYQLNVNDGMSNPQFWVLPINEGLPGQFLTSSGPTPGNQNQLTWTSGGAGTGTVTSITAGSNLVCTPNPITSAGSIALNSIVTDLTSIVVGDLYLIADTIASNTDELYIPNDLIISSGRDLVFEDTDGTSQYRLGTPDNVSLSWILPSTAGTPGQVLTTTTNGPTNTLAWANAGGTGTVTSVAVTGSAGLSVTGSPITSSGTIGLTLDTDLQTISALSGTGIMVRQSATSYLLRSLVTSTPNLIVTNAGGVNGNPDITLNSVLTGLTDVTIGPLNFASNTITSTNAHVFFGKAIQLRDGSNLVFSDTDNSHQYTINTPEDVTLTLRLPNSVGTAGQVLTTTGLNPANLYWSSVATGTVTSITAGNNIVCTPSTITNTGSVALNTTVSGLTSLEVQGITLNISGITTTAASLNILKDLRLQSGSNLILSDNDNSNTYTLSAPDNVTTNTTWTLPANNGVAGQFLTTNGLANNVLTWTSAGGSGTVTSVGITGSPGLSVTGSPITSSGAIALTLDNDLQTISQLSTSGIVVRESATIYHTRSLQTFDETTPVGWNNILITNPGGVNGDPIFRLNPTIYNMTRIDVGTMTLSGNTISTTNAQLLVTQHLNLRGGSNLRLTLDDVSGFYYGINSPTLTGNKNWTLPATNGTAGQFLTTNGLNNNVLTWTSGNAGTVTSVAVTGSTGLTVTGSPITSSGVIGLTLETDLQTISALSGSGYVVRSNGTTYFTRGITGGTNITTVNPNGGSGNTQINLNNSLTNLTSVEIGVMRFAGNYVEIIAPSPITEVVYHASLVVADSNSLSMGIVGNAGRWNLTAGTAPMANNQTWIVPNTPGTAGQVLTTSGLFNNQLSWMNQGQVIKRTVTNVNYTALATDYLIGVTSTSVAKTITLPTGASAGVGRVYIVNDEAGGASAGSPLTVNVTSGGLIDGATTQTITSAYGSLRFYSNGTNWFTW